MKKFFLQLGCIVILGSRTVCFAQGSETCPDMAPYSGTLHLAADPSFLFSTVTLINSGSGTVAATLEFEGIANNVSINLADYNIQSGLYTVRATAVNPWQYSPCDAMY